MVGSLAMAKEILGLFYKELVPKGAALEDVDSLADTLLTTRKRAIGNPNFRGSRG